MYFTMNMVFFHQLQMNFPEAVPPEDFTSKLNGTELGFLYHYKTLLT